MNSNKDTEDDRVIEVLLLKLNNNVWSLEMNPSPPARVAPGGFNHPLQSLAVLGRAQTSAACDISAQSHPRLIRYQNEPPPPPPQDAQGNIWHQRLRIHEFSAPDVESLLSASRRLNGRVSFPKWDCRGQRAEVEGVTPSLSPWTSLSWSTQSPRIHRHQTTPGSECTVLNTLRGFPKQHSLSRMWSCSVNLLHKRCGRPWKRSIYKDIWQENCLEGINEWMHFRTLLT